jgi:ABC-type antimicrobial peptide transport system permease subunit
VENEIFGKTVFLHEIINNGDGYWTGDFDIPVKIIGVSYGYAGGWNYPFITKKLADKLYRAENTFGISKTEDILIPYTNRGEINRLYDLFENDEFIRYVKSPVLFDGSNNIINIYSAIKGNDIVLSSTADDGTGTMKIYKLSVNSSIISPIYYLGKTFGLFNEIFKIIAVALIVIMVILLWSFMSFTIKTRTKDIGILISLGASKRDIGAIFVIEGALIAFGQIVISILSALIAKHFVRDFMVERMGTIIEKYNILSFGILQMLIMALIALTVTAISTTLPLLSLSKKQPVEIIRKIET